MSEEIIDKDKNVGNDGKMFTAEQQTVIDGIIKKKLAKVSAKHGEELASAKQATISELAKEFGIKPEEVKTVLHNTVTKERLADIADEAEAAGLPPEVLLQLKDLQTFKADVVAEKANIAKIKEEKDASATEIKKQLAAFTVSHPDIDVEKLTSDEDFFNYYSKLSESVKFDEAYDTYIGLVGKARASELADKAARDERSTADGTSTGGTHFGLSETQRALAKANDITEKDFAESLKESAYYNK